MNIIISTGTDEKILEEGRVFERVKEYASLVNGKYYCFVFTNNNTKNNYQRIDGNFIVVAVFGKNKFQQIWDLLRKVRMILNAESFSSLIWYPQDSFEIGFISYLFSRVFGGKLYTQCHTDISNKNFKNLSNRNYFQSLIAKFVFRKANKIRVVSQRMKNYIIEDLEIDSSKILKLPIYFDLNNNTLAVKEVYDDAAKVDFLIMSRIEKEKNIETAILALKEINNERILQKDRELILKIVGKGSEKKNLENKYKDKWILWGDWSFNPEIEYQSADYFLLPSLYEGWGMSAIESVSCGTPVIMTPVGCAGEVIINSKNGIISEGFGVTDFKKAMQRALNTEFTQVSFLESSLNTREIYLQKLKSFLV